MSWTIYVPFRERLRNVVFRFSVGVGFEQEWVIKRAVKVHSYGAWHHNEEQAWENEKDRNTSSSPQLSVKWVHLSWSAWNRIHFVCKIYKL